MNWCLRCSRTLVSGLLIVRETILERIIQRFALAGSLPIGRPARHCSKLRHALEHRSILVAGLRQAIAGRASVELPERLQSHDSHRVAAKESDLPLRVRTGDAKALAEALKRVADTQVDKAERIELTELLGQLKPSQAVSTLLKLANEVSSHAVQRVALRSSFGV